MLNISIMRIDDQRGVFLVLFLILFENRTKGERAGDAATQACARQAGFDGRLKHDRGWHPEQFYVQDATRNSI